MKPLPTTRKENARSAIDQPFKQERETKGLPFKKGGEVQGWPWTGSSKGKGNEGPADRVCKAGLRPSLQNERKRRACLQKGKEKHGGSLNNFSIRNMNEGKGSEVQACILSGPSKIEGNKGRAAFCKLCALPALQKAKQGRSAHQSEEMHGGPLSSLSKGKESKGLPVQRK